MFHRFHEMFQEVSAEQTIEALEKKLIVTTDDVRGPDQVIQSSFWPQNLIRSVSQRQVTLQKHFRTVHGGQRNGGRDRSPPRNRSHGRHPPPGGDTTTGAAGPSTFPATSVPCSALAFPPGLPRCSHSPSMRGDTSCRKWCEAG